MTKLSDRSSLPLSRPRGKSCLYSSESNSTILAVIGSTRRGRSLKMTKFLFLLPFNKVPSPNLQCLPVTLNKREGLMNYPKDGHCEISNNIAENSIRPFTVGRRNWLFSGSPKGASASPIVYSLVETAKANSLNPYKYLNLLLEILPRFFVDEKSERNE